MNNLLLELERSRARLAEKVGPLAAALAESNDRNRVLSDEIASLRAVIAEAREALREIAEHPEKHTGERGSYAVGWAFFNVQNIARAALSPLPPGSRVVVVPAEGSEEWDLAMARGMDASYRAVGSCGLNSEQYLKLRLTYALAAALRALTGGDDRE